MQDAWMQLVGSLIVSLIGNGAVILIDGARTRTKLAVLAVQQHEDRRQLHQLQADLRAHRNSRLHIRNT